MCLSPSAGASPIVMTRKRNRRAWSLAVKPALAHRGLSTQKHPQEKRHLAFYQLVQPQNDRPVHERDSGTRMAAEDGRFDGLFLNVAQQSQGIEPLLDNLFGFLRRKTDFFSGASAEQIEELVLKTIRKHGETAAREKAEKRAVAEKEEKKRALEKRKREEAAAKAKAATAEDGVLELSADGAFDASAAAAAAASAASAKAKAPAAATPPAPPAESKGEGEEGEGEGEAEEEDKTPPPPGNGGSTDKYTWTQTLSELSVVIPLPAGTKTKMLEVDIKNSKLRVHVKGQAEPLVNGELHKRVIVDDSLWTLEDGDLVITLQKDNKMEWWKCVLVGDPEINTQKVQPENSKLGDLDSETRQTVEKMMFDQRQKAQGLPSSDELQKQEMLQKFMAAHPEMDFSKAKFS